MDFKSARINIKTHEYFEYTITSGFREYQYCARLLPYKKKKYILESNTSVFKKFYF